MGPIVFVATFLVVAPVARGAECVHRVPAEQLASRIDAAEAAFGALDLDAFRDSAEAVALTLPCVDALVTPELAGRTHRLVGLQRYVGRDEEGAVSAFAAARAVAPGLRLTLSLVPSGHEAHDLWVRFPLENGATTRVARPLSGALHFDGVEGDERPDAWPTVVQLTDAEGAVLTTAWLRPRDALPTYLAAPFDPPGKRRKQARTGLLITSVASGATAGFLYGLAAASSRAFEQDQPGWTGEDLLAQRYRTNSLVVGSASAAGVALIAGGVGLALRVP